MEDLTSPALRLAPPSTPRRAPSPTMSPGGRRARHHGTSEEGRLRDLSPDTTLRAFTQRPVPFDTTRDEYKIFACIDSLTAAERDLGARVAKAAQRLKSWCAEIEQWGWAGSFEPPSSEFREKRRRSLERRIREHVGDSDLASTLPPLEYWGSLLSVEVESHEARLDDIAEEMLSLDVEELKEHVLDMHPSGRSRPSSAGFEASRQNYKPMDDFSFLITQTLLSALPHHAQLKDRLSTWTARISTLREVPRYIDDLATTQKAMRLGWDAIDPPTDSSDAAFAQWKEAVDTIARVLGTKVSDLGRRLDMMLDTLEGRDDCIPDSWIDEFEGIEANYGKWTHESRRKVMDFDLRRKNSAAFPRGVGTGDSGVHYKHDATQSTAVLTTELEDAGSIHPATPTTSNARAQIPISDNGLSDLNSTATTSIDAAAPGTPKAQPGSNLVKEDVGPEQTSQPSDLRTATKHVPSPVVTSKYGTSHASPRVTDSPASIATPSKKPWFMTEAVPLSPNDGHLDSDRQPQSPRATQRQSLQVLPESDLVSVHDVPEADSLSPEEESEFEEGDTIVHNEMEDITEAASPVRAVSQPLVVPSQHEGKTADVVRFRRKSVNPIIITIDGLPSATQEPPQTPRSRRGSSGSVSSELSIDSSPLGTVEDSPSVRNIVSRPLRAPRPELNAAMAKRRPMKSLNDNEITSAPWPPTQFTQKQSAEDLERKISDILTTIPAHIRLTSGPGPDSPEVKPRGITAKGSRPFLRAARSVSGLKSPELTLSPAKNDYDNGASGRKSAAATRGDNDIKLYHLTQPGKDQPIKLFIRRVGENGERVMVRVGGGWADLGEYLRQYAEHHGRRTASDGKFEILGLEVKNNDAVNSPARPESGLSKHDRRISGGRFPSSPLTTPTKASAPGLSSDDTVPPMPNFSSTPTLNETSVPSTNSSQRSWTGDEAGLAGPKTKKLDLSEDKLEWIEGMMKQARTVSGHVITGSNSPFQRDERGDSRSDSRGESRVQGKKPEFGDLGKVGGTKRIFLKGGKPVGE